MNLTIPLPISCKELVAIIKITIPVIFITSMLFFMSDLKVEMEFAVFIIIVGIFSGFATMLIGIDHLILKGSPIKFKCRCDN